MKKIQFSLGFFSYILIHFLPLFSFYTGVNLIDVFALVIFYVVNMFFVTAGYHRYFSHRAYKTNRFFQFIIAFMSQVTAQRGALWWASHHRTHHRYSDTKKDIHSPKEYGFWYSHFGWIFDSKNLLTDYKIIKDFAKYPELMWLNKYDLVPAFIMGFIFFMIGGSSMLFFSFWGGIAITWHATYTINSLSHLFGTRRYNTPDTSRNNWLLAILTLGEGWHNNHHHYMHSVKQGFFWYEYDFSYYILKILSFFRIVYDLRKVPEHKRIPNPKVA